MWAKSIVETKHGDWASSEGQVLGAPDLVLVFGATDALRASAAPARLARQFPQAIQLGCSTGTMVDREALTDDGVTALAIGFGTAPA